MRLPDPRRLRLRTIVLIPMIVALAASSLVVAVIIHNRVEADLIERIDNEIQRAILPLATQRDLPSRPALEPPDRSGDTEPASGPQQVTIDATGVVVETTPGSDLLASRDLGAMLSTDRATSDGEPRFRLGAARSGDLTVVVGLSLAEVDESLDSLRRNLAIGISALVVIQVAIAALLIRFVNRPLTRLSASAHRIAEGDLVTPIDSDVGPRETTELGIDLQTMVDRLTTTIAEREAAAADAQEARAEIEHFMRDVSHELRTPLTAITGYADLHAEGMLDGPGVDEAMVRIRNESDRLTDLVRDMLQLLRPTDSRQVERVDLGAVASAAVQDLRAAHPDHPIALELSGEHFVIADAARLHQAVLNLGANACQHTPVGTPVAVRVVRDDDGVRLAVHDSGPGMEPELAARVLQPFVRGDIARTRSSHDGSGLGLALTDRIARQHGGSIAIETAPGSGTTFWLTLPAASA